MYKCCRLGVSSCDTCKSWERCSLHTTCNSCKSRKDHYRTSIVIKECYESLDQYLIPGSPIVTRSRVEAFKVSFNAARIESQKILDDAHTRKGVPCTGPGCLFCNDHSISTVIKEIDAILNKLNLNPQCCVCMCM